MFVEMVKTFAVIWISFNISFVLSVSGNQAGVI
jgi:hypothetical protein